MRRLLLVGCVVGTFTASHAASAQAGISLGAAVGSTWSGGSFQFDDERHGLVYLRLGVPLMPYGARGEFLVYDAAGQDYDSAVIASGILSLSMPLIQPYAMVGYGRYGMRSTDDDGVSFGAGVRIGGRRGVFIEGRRHEPIDRSLFSIGIAF